MHLEDSIGKTALERLYTGKTVLTKTVHLKDCTLGGRHIEKTVHWREFTLRALY